MSLEREESYRTIKAIKELFDKHLRMGKEKL